MTSPAGEVVKPGAWKSVADEGMPVHGRPYEKGNLYIHFNVKFPDALTQQQVPSAVLPGACWCCMCSDAPQVPPRATLHQSADVSVRTGTGAGLCSRLVVVELQVEGI